MFVKNLDHLNLKQIAESGQCFRFKEIEENKYSTVAFGRYLEVTQKGDEFTFSCDEDEYEKIWASYFDTKTDYAAIEKLILSSNDDHLKEAFKEGYGIRILRQDLWEMIVTFIISQNNNIKRITNSVEAICQKAGRKTDCKRGCILPEPGDIREGFFMDKTLGLGYRDSYLEEIYSYAVNNPGWTDSLKGMDYETAMETLVERKGIGKKVANCICLFGLHHVEAFPIDTHVKQLLEKYYPKGFDFERYEGIAGIIQQYLFYYELKHK
ncbi:MAG: 8-oxoguanine DNA glycosylase [Eubacterium sp.]|nr:8-oxoguanine DNA glycosylase [Eubacterium sp.]